MKNGREDLGQHEKTHNFLGKQELERHHIDKILSIQGLWHNITHLGTSFCLGLSCVLTVLGVTLLYVHGFTFFFNTLAFITDLMLILNLFPLMFTFDSLLRRLWCGGRAICSIQNYS